MRFPVWEEDQCGHCGVEKKDTEAPDEPMYRLTCPSCYRDGCHECMPAGRGCDCPECEDEAG